MLLDWFGGFFSSTEGQNNFQGGKVVLDPYIFTKFQNPERSSCPPTPLAMRGSALGYHVEWHSCNESEFRQEHTRSVLHLLVYFIKGKKKQNNFTNLHFFSYAILKEIYKNILIIKKIIKACLILMLFLFYTSLRNIYKYELYI